MFKMYLECFRINNVKLVETENFQKLRCQTEIAKMYLIICKYW